MKDEKSVNQKNILVVDDVAEICSLLSNFLQLKGHRVDTANTIAQARKLLSENSYSAVITNMYLGEKSSADGLQVIELVRQFAAETPVIVMSGGASHETWARITRFKVQGLLRKPFLLEDFYTTLHKAMTASSVEVATGT